MRLNKLAELIHKSAQHPDCSAATVRVHFTDILDHEKDPDLFTEVTGSNFTVSRTVNRSSVSKYMINDSPVDYKEVVQLLMEKGIDLDHNRFLILQGEVEQISLMKPKSENEHDQGLLEYLDEIIGSSVHVEKIK
jgi:structural maintenance of chromosome 4